jgi:hypothetical protein
MKYVCECLDPSCRERLTLTEDQYAALASAGAVVSRWCALREGKLPLDRRGEAVAVRTSAAVFAAGRRSR